MLVSFEDDGIKHYTPGHLEQVYVQARSSPYFHIMDGHEPYPSNRPFDPYARIQPGSKVKLSNAYVEQCLASAGQELEDQSEHAEFSGCIGVVIDCEEGQEHLLYEAKIFNVRWQPSGLRYGYTPLQIEVVNG
jgi:hypothetical protein